MQGQYLMASEEQNPQNNNPQHPLSLTKWLDINIALEQKGQEFLSLGHLGLAVGD